MSAITYTNLESRTFSRHLIKELVKSFFIDVTCLGKFNKCIGVSMLLQSWGLQMRIGKSGKHNHINVKEFFKTGLINQFPVSF